MKHTYQSLMYLLLGAGVAWAEADVIARGTQRASEGRTMNNASKLAEEIVSMARQRDSTCELRYDHDDAVMIATRSIGEAFPDAPAAPEAIDPDLIERCKELIEWGKTGLLHGGEGGALRKLADAWEPKVGEHHALSLAEKETLDEAMKALVQFAAPPARSAASTVEPVVWQWQAPGKTHWHTSDPAETEAGRDILRALGYVFRPLYAAPITSPEPFRNSPHLTDDIAAVVKGAKMTAIGGRPIIAPEPSAIFHATGLAGERLARLQGAGADMIDATSPQSVADWTDDGNCNAGKSAPEPDAVRVARIIDPEAFEDDRLTWHDRRVQALYRANSILAALSRPAHAGWEADQKELEALRKVGWCAQALISSDEIKHPTLSRADAVAEAQTRLRQQLGKWQMEFCSAKALSRKERRTHD